MKTRVLLIIFTALLFFSCSDDNSEKDSIIGAWKLSSVYGGLQGVNINYDNYTVVWSFENNNVVSIENNIITTGPEQLHAGFSTGTYPYEIRIESGNEVLYIDNFKQGVISLTSNGMTLDNCIACDGYIKEFNSN